MLTALQISDEIANPNPIKLKLHSISGKDALDSLDYLLSKPRPPRSSEIEANTTKVLEYHTPVTINPRYIKGDGLKSSRPQLQDFNFQPPLSKSPPKHPTPL
jgi:hypothetical protein